MLMAKMILCPMQSIIKVFLAACLLGSLPHTSAQLVFPRVRSLDVLYQWTVVRFALPPEFQPDPTYRANDTYISGITDTPDFYVFSLPRALAFHPATVGYVPKSVAGQSPEVQPYPNLYWNRRPMSSADCNTTLVSVFRTVRDRCNRLWVLDAGIVGNSASTVPGQQLCPPKIAIFNLDNNSLARVITVPNNVLSSKSTLLTIFLDYEFVMSNGGNTCDDVFVYIADGLTPSIIVNRSPTNTFYSFTHPSMYPDPDDGIVTVDSVTFTNMVGVVGLTKASQGDEKRLYYNAFASKTVYSIPTRFLQQGPYTGDPSGIPVAKAFTKTSQGLALFTDAYNGDLVFNPVVQHIILSTEPKLRGYYQTLLASNDNLIKFVHDYTNNITNNKVILAATSRFQNYFTRTVNEQEINLRILKVTQR